MRGRSPQYYATLASRPAPPQKKLELMRRAYELFANDVGGGITRYAQALAEAGREEDAIAKFNQAMGIEPDHMTVLIGVCEFLKSRRRIPAARAVADWLTRLNPGAAPIEMLRARLRRPAGLAYLRCALCVIGSAQTSGFPGGRTKPPRTTPSPLRERLLAPSGALGSPGRPASPPAIHSWLRHAATIGALPKIFRRYRPPWRLAGSPMAGARLARQARPQSRLERRPHPAPSLATGVPRRRRDRGKIGGPDRWRQQSRLRRGRPVDC